MAHALCPTGAAVANVTLHLCLLFELWSWANHIALTGRGIDGFDMELN
jgi:hypothetical protein